MPVCEYFQQDIIIIALTSEDICSYIELTSDVKLLQTTVCGYHYSFKSRTAVSGRCVTTAVC